MANSPTPFTLRQIIIADAATCLAMGALLVIAPRVIAVLTQIPESLLFYAGVGLFPIAFFMAIVGLRFPTSAPGASLVIIGNILWVIASVSLLFVLKSLNAIGVVLILAQAAAVAVLAWLEFVALRGNGYQIARAA